MIDADLIREARWLDPDDEPEADVPEPTEEELAEQRNDHVLRAWDYLANNSEAIDNALRDIIQLGFVLDNKWTPLDNLLKDAVNQTKTAPVDARR